MDRHPYRLDCRGRHRADCRPGAWRRVRNSRAACSGTGGWLDRRVPRVVDLGVPGFESRGVNRSVLLILGFVPAWIAQGRFASDAIYASALMLVFMLLWIPWITLMAGLLSSRREGWRDTRPPALVVLGALALPVVLSIMLATGMLSDARGCRATDWSWRSPRR